jgi:ubiquinone/menaquinone biosynthesis C-methylase UbiE
MAEIERISRDNVAAVLRCFRCQGDLHIDPEGFRCTRCDGVFFLRGNIIEGQRSVRSAYGSWFGDLAPVYERVHGLTEQFSRWLGARFHSVLKRYTTLPARLLVEIGCGTGVTTRAFLLSGLAGQILATDASVEMLEQAAQHSDSENVLFLAQDSHVLDLHDAVADLVVGGSVLHHLADISASLSEIRRILKPCGVAVFLEPFYPGNRVLGFLIQWIIAELRLAGWYDKETLEVLRMKAESYASVLEFRHRRRHDPIALSTLDDKRLFLRGQLHREAIQSGFSGVEFESLYDTADVNRQTVVRDIAFDILRSLAHEAGVEVPNLASLAMPALDAFSEFYSEFLLTDFGPQEFVVLKTG